MADVQLTSDLRVMLSEIERAYGQSLDEENPPPNQQRSNPPNSSFHNAYHLPTAVYDASCSPDLVVTTLLTLCAAQ